MPLCFEQAISEDYYDYIYNHSYFPIPDVDSCRIDAGYGIGVYFRPKEDGFAYENYYTLPKLFGLADVNAAEAAGALKIQRPDSLGLTGNGCLIGLIDTGIQYDHEVFLDEQGRSRVVGIWDQTAEAEEITSGKQPINTDLISNLPTMNEDNIENSSSASEITGNSANGQTLQNPRSVPYGTAYTQDEILAGSAKGQDENGHGTFLASLAAGRNFPTEGFTGIAPEAKIAMVKLKSAKCYLRELFLINKDAIAYEESDILLGVRYLLELAEELSMPLVILLGLESSSGSHTGSLALDDYLSQVAARAGVAVVCAAGNEGDKKHHYYGSFSSGDDFLDAELNIGNLAPALSENSAMTQETAFADSAVSQHATLNNDVMQQSSSSNDAKQQSTSATGFTLEFWGTPPDIYSLSVISPGGEMIPRVTASITQNGSYDFLLSQTVVEVGFRLLEFLSGDQLIFLRFRNPTPGIWRIRVYGRNLLYGSFHMWLPIEAFLSRDVFFLSPNPDTTVTAPGNSTAILTFSGYDSRTGSFYPASGRGYTAKGQITPELAAPAANILGARVVPGRSRTPQTISGEIARFERRSGTSCAAAIGAGACALLLEWGILQNHLPGMRNIEIRNILIRGAGRSRNLSYPNREFGYGTLNIEDAFLVLADLL
ncbi:MAG: S8 family peptidase [Lachnospiraceae bacterium]|nr:S8 family peptidase [Lachnospiraceae bacterium]